MSPEDVIQVLTQQRNQLLDQVTILQARLVSVSRELDALKNPEPKPETE